MKQLKKFPIIPLIIGVLLVTYGLLAHFLDSDVFNITPLIANIIISLGLIAFAIIVVWPDLTKENIKFLKTIEFIIIIIGAIIGFLLPAFDVETISLGSGSLWFGLALTINGGLELYFSSFGKRKHKFWVFLVHLFSVMLGTYIYARNLIDAKIELITILFLLISGLYFVIIGLLELNKKKKG